MSFQQEIRQIIRELLFSAPGDESRTLSSDIRNTRLFKILSANPSVARFYPHLYDAPAANPNTRKILQIRSEFFSESDQAEKQQATAQSASAKGSSYMVSSNTRICSHIKVDGVPCGSPALRGEVFCYFHQRMIRGVRTPPKSRLHPVAMLEDENSIQMSLMEVINALIRNTIDVPRARLILRGLHIAVRNSAHARFYRSGAVTEVPEYPEVPENKPPEPALEQAGVLALINKPKPRFPSDYGMTPEQALECGYPPEKMQPPRDLAEANASVARYIQRWMACDAASSAETALAKSAQDSKP